MRSGRSERTGIAHRKELFGILPVALAAEGLGQRKLEFERRVTVRRHCSGAASTLGCRAREVLCVIYCRFFQHARLERKKMWSRTMWSFKVMRVRFEVYDATPVRVCRAERMSDDLR